MLNIPFNANDLRLTVYLIISVVMLLLGIKYSKEFEKSKLKVIYNVAILAANICLTYYYYTVFMWA
jgi:hypothetical protein